MANMDRISVRDITNVDTAEPGDTEGFDADQVCAGRQVTLHFEVALADGEVIDSNFDRAAATLRMGDGNLPPGFEQALVGLRQGDEHTAQLPAMDAFGPHNPDNIQTFPRYRFPADLAMEEGLVINFADNAGNEQAGVIRTFDASRVTVDFNHPLAGKDIRFRVKIVSVTD